VQIPAAVLWDVGKMWEVEPVVLAEPRLGEVLVKVVAARYALADINEGYADMHTGKNLRGVVLHES
jgi:S-(hydroxymethyl)glutathione dehydrogenase/alcohol dehydrogenase